MSRLPLNVLYYGKEEPLPEQAERTPSSEQQRLLRGNPSRSHELRAGPLTLVFEAGDLRYLRLGDREVMRRIYSAVRDRNWGTVPTELTNVRVQTGPDSFQITYDAENRRGEIDFAWKGTITGERDGTIRFEMEGEAHSTFLRSRIGFCVLHPVRECAGQPCVVEHADGSLEEGAFPRFISPHQPFFDMGAITHEVVPGLRAEVRFAGDVFEMEDQRNWTDASFKTYCTPLRLPFPVEVRKGTRIRQSVTLTLRGAMSEVQQQAEDDGAAVTLDAVSATLLPRLGLGMASHGQPLTDKEIGRLRALALSHLRVDLPLADPGWAANFQQAVEQSLALGLPLEVALHLTDAAVEELRRFAASLERLRPPVAGWLIFHVAEKSTAERWARLAREHLAAYDPSAQFGAGTNAYFTELNRGRPPIEALDRVTYSINPQVHAFDNASLVETLEAQGSTVESAREFIGDLPLQISPVTLRPRFNPNATGPEPEPGPGELPSAVDLRQMSLFGAGWTAGSIKYLAESGVASITYYETTGWRGVMETAAGSPLPDQFRSLPGAVFPLYHVFAAAGEFAGGEVLHTASSRPLEVEALMLRKDGRTRLILANLSPKPQPVRIGSIDRAATVRSLDETNAEQAMLTPEAFWSAPGQPLQPSGGALELRLLPYAVAFIDGL